MRRHLIRSVAVTGVAVLQLNGQVARLDPAIDRLVPAGANVEKLAGDLRFTEGPVWVRDGGYLLFSDLMQNAIMKWSPGGGATVFRKQIFAGSYPDGVLIGTNGLTLDKQRRIVAAEHGNRRVSRIEKDGKITVLADHYEGKRLNSPNDLVSKKNGDIYFTDPTGLYGTYPEGPDKPKQELGFNGVYRITAAGKLDLLTKDVQYPNGIAFSPDEKKLYVSNSRPDKYWMAFDVQADGTLANGHKLYDATKEPGMAVPDGMKVDSAGNLYMTGPGGLLIVSPEGKHLGTIQLPEIAANCAWGDADAKSLYIAARTGLYRIKLSIAGIKP